MVPERVRVAQDDQGDDSGNEEQDRNNDPDPVFLEELHGGVQWSGKWQAKDGLAHARWADSTARVVEDAIGRAQSQFEERIKAGSGGARTDADASFARSMLDGREPVREPALSRATFGSPRPSALSLRASLPSPTQEPRLKRLAKKLGISAAALVLAGFGAELVLRGMEAGPFSFFDRYPYVESKPDIHVRHKPGFVGRWDSTWYEIDERGFRGKTDPLTFAPDELRVVCLGDSCTFGKGVEDRDTWPRQLESRLTGIVDGKVVVFNLGLNGAHPRVYRQILEEHVDELKPNLILIGYNINDFPNTIRAVDEKVFDDRKLRKIVPQSVRDAFGRLALYRKARAVYYDTQKARDWKVSEKVAAQAAKDSEDGIAVGASSQVWDLQREYLSGIRDMANAIGADVQVFLFPYESQVFLDTYDRTPIETLSKVCGELDMSFFDLTGRFRSVARKETPPRQLFIAGDRYHPNAEGYGVVADVVLEQLLSTGAVQGAGQDD
ncbi:MAG: lysophospholipase L1-like esterase [Paracoccaceae bacterium]